MRLCSVTSLMKFYPLPEALAVIAEAGYQGVELWGGLPHAYTDDFYEGSKLDQATVDRCRRLLDASGLEPVSFLPEQCFYPVNFLIDEAPPFDGAKLRERSLAYFERAIDLTAALGIARMLVTTPFWGWARDGERFRSSTSRSRSQRAGRAGRTRPSASSSTAPPLPASTSVTLRRHLSCFSLLCSPWSMPS